MPSATGSGSSRIRAGTRRNDFLEMRNIVRHKTGKEKSIAGGLARLFLFVVTAFAVLSTANPAARAQCTDCSCVSAEHLITRLLISQQHLQTRTHIFNEFTAQQSWLLEWVWRGNILPALQMMTEQIVTTAMLQVAAIGTMVDAKEQLETQRLFQELTARAHKDYQPSTGMCTIGTAARSLADSERRAQYTAFVLSQRSQDRQMGNMNTSASSGSTLDLESRMEQFKRRHCDIKESNNGLDSLCGASAPSESVGRDIDYNRLIETPLTMAVDFSDTETTRDEEDLIALNNNLYAHKVFERMPETSAQDPDKRAKILDQRAVIAKRSVIENSFHTIAGMKARGSASGAADTAKYIGVVLKNLGVKETDVPDMIGDRPSYYAQMDVLTKKIYQQPEFYTDLYDTPANVDRKGVALEAIGLMQDFDIWQSYLRTEAMLSVWLDLELSKRQDEVQNATGKLQASGGGSK